RSFLLSTRNGGTRDLIGIAEANEHLVEHDIVENLRSSIARESLRHLFGAGAESIDERLDAAAPEVSDGGVGRNGAPAAGKLRHPVDGVALRACGLFQIL